MEIRSKGSSPVANAVNGVELGMNRLEGDMFGDERETTHQHPRPTSQSVMTSMGERGGISSGNFMGGGGGGDGTLEMNEDAGRRVACGRKGKILCWHE